VRKVVISHPYDADANRADTWTVYDLSVGGNLSATGHDFVMGLMLFGDVVFTADGAVGIAAQHDGTLGVLRFDGAGPPVVVHARFSGSFYADSVVIAPDGEFVWVVDGGWPEDGGGIYRVRIGCDGTLTDEGRVLPTKNASALVLLPEPGYALVEAREVGSSPAGEDVHLVDLWTGCRASGIDVFPDNEQSVAAAVLSGDGRYALFADASAYSSVPNRIAVVEILDGGLRLAQTISPLPYAPPSGLVFSPYGNAVLLITAEALQDALTYFAYDPTDTVEPFTYAGEVDYLGGRPELPDGASLITRGGLRGRVIIAEVSGIRQVQFLANGTVVDADLEATGAGMENIVGAVGAQP
jgi:hypothetical protein